MQNKKEHLLALKISIGLLFFTFFVIPVIMYNLPKKELIHMGINRHFLNRYLVFGFISIFIYFLSYYFAKKTFEPIKQANKKLKEYNYNVAHELKTPLSVIKSDLELLEMGKKLDYNILKSTKQEIELMQDIIDSLLFLSEKQISLDKKEIDLGKYLNLFLKNNCEEKYFKLRIKNNKEIKIEKKLFKIMLKNLFENARKYGDLKNKIEIILDENALTIKNKVFKNSPQINTDKIFDTFYMGDNSRAGTGYGLGLNIVKKIIDLHNFSIKVDLKDEFFIVKIIL